MKSKVGGIIGVVAVLVVLLFIMATWVGYSDKVTNLEKYGSWRVETSGKVQLVLGKVYGSIQNLTAHYDKSGNISGYREYLSHIFSGKEGVFEPQPWNETVLCKVRVTVKATDKDGLKLTLFDESQSVRLAWNGGTITKDGTIMSYDFEVGPFLAKGLKTPLKIEEKVFVDGVVKAVKATYLTLPDWEKLDENKGAVASQVQDTLIR